MKKSILLILLFSFTLSFGQTRWESSTFNYSIEIPDGFERGAAISNNGDFKATKGNSSIVVIVKVLPSEFSSYTIWDMIGDLESFGEDWELGAQEYMNNPQFIKYGKTKIDGLDTFWYDYTTDQPELYSKTYQTQINGKFFTFTLTSEYDKFNNYSPIWFRFKENIDF